MDLTQALNRFAVRLFEWSQEDFLREVESDCPLLRLMGLNNRFVMGFVEWNKTLSSEERRSLVQALTKRTHSNAIRLEGEVLSDEDREWHRAFYENSAAYENELPPLLTADRRDPAFRPVDADHCLDVLVASLSPFLGVVSRRKSIVRCTRRVGDWKIITEFIFRRREPDLIFEYQFVRKDGQPIKGVGPGPFPRTLLMFYGLWASQVRVPSNADSEPMAKMMAKLAEYFVRQAGSLFDGLGLED